MGGFRSPEGQTDWVSVCIGLILILIIIFTLTGVVPV